MCPINDSDDNITKILLLYREDRKDGLKKDWWSGLGEFFRSPLGSAVLTLIFTTLLGACITFYFGETSRKNAELAQNAQRKADADANRARTNAANRSTLVDATAKMLTARRVYAATLRSAIDYQAPQELVDARWANYQDAYLNYNYGVFAFRSSALTYLGAKTAKVFADKVEKKISVSFSRIDSCLSDAYFQYKKGHRAGAASSLRGCHGVDANALSWNVKDEINKLNSCIYTFEGELAYSIYIENNFEALPEESRVSPVKYADNQIVDCGKHANWVCLRQLNRSKVGEKLSAGCDALGSENYVKASPKPPSAITPLRQNPTQQTKEPS